MLQRSFIIITNNDIQGILSNAKYASSKKIKSMTVIDKSMIEKEIKGINKVKGIG